MAKPPTPDDLYSFGRSYPHGQPHDRRHPTTPRTGDMAGPYHRHEEVQGPQTPEDQRGPGYSNDARGWLRGAKGEPGCDNETAEGKPSFDHSPPRDKMRR
jgi:hypothetical protein